MNISDVSWLAVAALSGLTAAAAFFGRMLIGATRLMDQHTAEVWTSGASFRPAIRLKRETIRRFARITGPIDSAVKPDALHHLLDVESGQGNISRALRH